MTASWITSLTLTVTSPSPKGRVWGVWGLSINVWSRLGGQSSGALPSSPATTAASVPWPVPVALREP